MESKENDIDYKILRILVNNEIDLEILIEYFDRLTQNLLWFRKKLEGTTVSTVNTVAASEFSKFIDQLKRIKNKYPEEVQKFIRDGIDPAEKFELMLQNAEKLVWLFELERKK